MPTPNLSLSFDIEQISSQLVPNFPVVVPSITPTTGLYAGTIALTPEFSFGLEVVASGFTHVNDSFKVTDCCIVTQPGVLEVGTGNLPQFSAPSPFHDVKVACLPLQGSFNPPPGTKPGIDADKKTHSLTLVWNDKLVIGGLLHLGGWLANLFLTVELTLHDKVEKPYRVHRVFSFPPDVVISNHIPL